MNNKKTILGIMIANIMAAPVITQADELEIYGTVSGAVEALDNDGTTKNITEVSSNHSAFGVKGATDLGGGLKGVFLFDTFLGTDSGDSGNGSLFGGGRDGYVGLAGGFGTIALGYHGRPWKTSTNNMDVFGSTIADYSAILGRTPGGTPYFDGGIGNAVIWFAPSSNGVSGHLQFGADEADDSTSDTGVQVNYTAGNMYLTLSHDIDGQGTGNDISATKVAGQFKLGASTVGVIFDSISSDTKNNSRDAFWVSGTYKMGSQTFKAAIAQASESDAAAGKDGATYIALGVDHSFKKNVTGYVIYSQVSNDDNGAYGFVSAPHTSSNGNTAATAGKDMSVLSVGVKVDFSLKK